MQIHIKLIWGANTLKTHLVNAIQRERPEFMTKRWFLLQDNSRLHIAHLVTEVLAGIGGTTVEHPPYSPDFATCDFLAFATLKHEL
jgi:hypothetical protein